MNKAELINLISEKVNVSKKQAEDMLETLLGTITSALKSGGEVTLTGFGTFSARTRSSRMGVNPQKPSEKIQIPTVIVPKFKAGKALKDALKKPTPSAQA
ncbi:MAG: HU family DNA-binding protein [Patescibacteria group bacterium]|nr:HU family DNA-binding protein [Patescibacteria group bacterium]MDD5491007.1 HU family DNA-binding protein [Patescibacteria group bacterium]